MAMDTSSKNAAIVKISYAELATALGLPPDVAIQVCMQTHTDMVDGFLRLGIAGSSLPAHFAGGECVIIPYAEMQEEK